MKIRTDGKISNWQNRGRAGLLLLVSIFLACHVHRPPVVSPVDGIACEGKIDPPAHAFREVADETLLKNALDATGKGRLCAGRAYEVIRPFTVYRLWSKGKDYSQFGKWWSMKPPKGSAETYRKEYDVCPEWNDLNMVKSCTLKTGIHVAIGPGQSAHCEGGLEYAKSAANQLYIQFDPNQKDVFFENCSDGAPWP